jgi:hypothetical protein
MTVFYSASFDIFEALIRQGLMNNDVEITSHQLNRICNPVLEDQNQNLLFQMAQGPPKQLRILFEKTSIAKYFNPKTKRAAFFMSFNKY